MEYLKVFTPIIIILLGAFILIAAGINNTGATDVFSAMRYMAWYGWFGTVIMFGGILWIMGVGNFIKKLFK